MTKRPMDDRELMRELDALSDGYGRQAGGAPPAAADAAVLARARASAGRRRVPAWWIPATLAATVVIAFSLMLRVQEDAAPVPAVVEAARPASDLEAPAAPAAAPASAEVPSQPDIAALRAPAGAKSAGPPDPEAWLERIEALEAAGRTEEAAAERERLDAAFPGWLEQRPGSRD